GRVPAQKTDESKERDERQSHMQRMLEPSEFKSDQVERKNDRASERDKSRKWELPKRNGRFVGDPAQQHANRHRCRKSHDQRRVHAGAGGDERSKQERIQD